MGHVAIVTDTDASLPIELAEREQIYQVPVSVIFGSESSRSYEACFEINDAQLFEQIAHKGKLPTTAAPAPGKFVQSFKKAFDDGADSVICLCVSSEVSATCKSALAACDLMPGRRISVVDSQSLSMGQGYMALAAAEAARNGCSHEEVLSIAEDTRLRSRLFATLPTLKYLAMSGRVSHLAAGMASMLDIKPILTIKDGKLQMLERVRTWRKAQERLIELVKRERKDRQIERLAIVYVNAIEDASKLMHNLLTNLTYAGEVILTELNPGMSPHTGTGLVGVGFVLMN
jgi:DegV family protein with EDD domain